MTNSWHRACSKFFAYSYDPKGWDCADLTLAVQRELFGRSAFIPEDRKEARRQMRSIMSANLTRTDNAVDGDVVIMREVGRTRADHVGTYLVVGGEPCVFHTTEKTDCIFTRLRHLEDLGLSIEGIYTWRT